MIILNTNIDSQFKVYKHVSCYVTPIANNFRKTKLHDSVSELIAIL